MLPGCLFEKELLEEWKSRKGLVIRLVLPLFVLAPLVFAPPGPRASGFVIGVLFIGVFGSSIGLARIRESGMLERLIILPIPPSRLLVDYVLANSVADLLQLVVPFLVVLGSGSPDPLQSVVLPIFFVSAVIAANAIGTLIPLASGSSAEVHLASFVAVLAAFGISTPALPLVYTVGQFLPFGALSVGFQTVWNGSLPSWSTMVSAPVAAAAILGVVVLCAGRLKPFE